MMQVQGMQRCAVDCCIGRDLVKKPQEMYAAMLSAGRTGKIRAWNASATVSIVSSPSLQVMQEMEGRGFVSVAFPRIT